MTFPDVVRDFYPYVKARVALKSRLAQVEALRDSGKRRAATKLLRKIQTSREFKLAKRFEDTYAA
jgi:hypothetical protein